MRILFVSHTPIDDSVAGRFMRRGIDRLRAAGNEVRALTVDGDPARGDLPHIRRVLCHASDRNSSLPFSAPGFGGRQADALHFAQLTDRRLSDYRDVLRMEFDREVDLYDPHIVHTGQLWLFAHLALEAGTPYVASTHGGEFETADRDRRYRRYMLEAAENAGRILTHSDAAHEAVTQLVGDLEGRVRRLPYPSADEASDSAWWRLLGGIYRETYVDRYGREPN